MGIGIVVWWKRCAMSTILWVPMTLWKVERVFNAGDINNLRELTIWDVDNCPVDEDPIQGSFWEISALHCHLLAVVVAGMFSYHRWCCQLLDSRQFAPYLSLAFVRWHHRQNPTTSNHDWSPIFPSFSLPHPSGRTCCCMFAKFNCFRRWGRRLDSS